MNIIQLNNICKQYDQPILTDISLSVKKGEFVVITGPSGCGKSTLLQIMGMLDRVSSGEYLLDGNPVHHQNLMQLAQLRHRYIGFIFQRYHLVNYLSVLENILLPLQYGLHDEKVDLAHQYLKELGLENHTHHLPHQLSYGQQQRVAIIRAKITQPEIILADEPTGSLDEGNTDIVMEQLRQMNQDGKTVILITHNTQLIDKTDKHYILSQHKLERA